MKDDGRLKSLGILFAMVAVILAFFAMFLRRPEVPSRPLPPAASDASVRHREAPLPHPVGSVAPSSP